MTRKTRAAIAQVHRDERTQFTEYEGFLIANVGGDYQVRMYQEDLDLWHTWRPWCESLEEAEHVIEKLIARAEAGETEAKAWE